MKRQKVDFSNLGQLRDLKDDGWFFRALFPSFKEMYEKKMQLWMLPDGAIGAAERQCPRLLVHEEFVRTVVTGGQKRNVKFLKRVVLHALKTEINNQVTRQHDPPPQSGVREELVVPMEWFAVECEGGEKVWLALDKVDNLQEFLEAMFKSELQSLLKRIDRMVGLEEFKTELFPNLAKQIVGRAISGMPRAQPKNAVILGAPGVGKSTCMRALGTLYWLAGILLLGHMPLEGIGEEKPWRGTELPSQIVGGTAEKVRMAVLDAKGGVFALDEAHNLATLGQYGKEAVGTLNGLMTEFPDILFMIAGYPENMEALLKMDKGLASRFDGGLRFTLEPYNCSELTTLCRRDVEETNNLMMGSDSLIFLNESFYGCDDWWRPDYGNARAMMSLARSISDLHAERVGASQEKTYRVVSLDTVKTSYIAWYKRSPPGETSVFDSDEETGLRRLRSLRDRARRESICVSFKNKLLQEERKRIDQFLDMVCVCLDYKADVALSFKRKVIDFLKSKEIVDMAGIVKQVTEEMLKAAKLRPLWPSVQALCEGK